MLNWLKKRAVQRQVATAEAELEDWIRKLENADPPQVGFTLGMTTHARNELKRDLNIDLLYPDVVVLQTPNIAADLVYLIQRLQKIDAPVLASGYFPWVFTLRAAKIIETRNRTKYLWKILSSGIPYVETECNNFSKFASVIIHYDGYQEFPLGFHPLGHDRIK